MANVAGEEHVFRRESLQGTTTVTFRSRRYHLPSVIVNQPHHLDPKTQGPHEECLLLNVGLYCPYCASKMQVSSKHQRVAVARDSEGNLIAQPMGPHPSGHPHTFQSLPYDRVQQHLQEQHRLQAAAQGLPHHHHHQPSQAYQPNFYPGSFEEKPSQTNYLQELRYQPQSRQTQSLPNRYLPLEYGFIEQHEGSFSFEENKRKPHQRSRLKEMHTDSLKLQKRKQRLKLAEMGVHGDGAIPEVQSPSPPHTDSKPGTPEETVVPIPVVGFENPNFDYAAAENNRRYKEQQKKQQKLLQRQEQMRQQHGETQQPYPHMQQSYEHPPLQHPSFQSSKQQQQQHQQQQQQPAQKGKQAEVFVNNYALDYESSRSQAGGGMRHEAVPGQHVIGPDGKRYFTDVNQQQQYWKQQEELMLQKENLKHQELYRKQQELLYMKQQEKLYRQQQQQYKKAHEQYRRQQLEQQGKVEPQRYNNLEKQQHKDEDIRQQTEQIADPNISLMQEYMIQQQKYARRQQQQQQQRQQQDEQGIPSHAPETFDDIVGEKHIHHHYSHPPEQETTSEKNIQVDNLPREFFHQKPVKREREHRQKEKHPKKRHKHHRHADRVANRRLNISNQTKEQELFLIEPPDTDKVEVRETKITQEQPKQEHPLTHDEHERKKMEKMKREHRQNTVYYKERNTTEEQSFARYTTARTLYDRCVKEMKGLHATESLDFVKNQTKIASKIRRDSCRSDASSSTAPARSETSEASTDDLRQTKGGIFFANVHRRGSVDSAEPVESPPAGLEFTLADSTKLSSESKSDTSADLFPANIKYDPTNQQHILSVSAEADIGDDAATCSPGASFEEIDDSLQKYMEWLQTEENRQRQLSSGTKTVNDEDVMKESSSQNETGVSEVSLTIREEVDENGESKRSSFLEPLEDVVEVEKWDSNGTTYSVYIVTKKINEDKDEDYDLVDINSEVIAMLDHSMESVEQLELEVPEEDKNLISFSSSDIPTIQEPPGKDGDVRFYISSSSEFLEESETRSTGSYRISEEELLDLEYRVPTILDENENSLLRSSLDTIKENTGSFLQVPPSATHIESSDGDDVEMQLDESAEEKEFEKIMSSEEMYDSTSDEDFSRDPSFDIEEEVDDILENVEVETYSPTSTLSKASSQPRKKKKSARMLRHIQPPDMVPIPSAESNSEMTSSTSSNQEILQSLDIQTAQYQQLVSECTTTTDEDADKSENDAKDEDAENSENVATKDFTDISGKDENDVEYIEDSENSGKYTEGLEDVNAKSEPGKAMEEDTEEEESPVIPGISPEDAFEVVVEAASEESYGSDWPSDHDEFLPKVIKGKGKKSSDMFMYDFYHEKLSQKRTSSCECVADGASVGRISDIGSDDLERSMNDELAEIEDKIGKSTLEVPGTGEQVMSSSMTSSNISDGSLEQIIDDTMQLTERILSSCEKVDTTKSLENIMLSETDERTKPQEIGDNEEEAKSGETELHQEKKISDPEPNFPPGEKDAEIKELERDTKDLEEISRWSEETVKTVEENNPTEDVVEFSDVNAQYEEDVIDVCDKRQETVDGSESKSRSDEEMGSESEEVSIEWSQDTVRKSSFDSLDTAEIIHVIDDIIEDEIYDTNEDERSLTEETTSLEKQDAAPTINMRSQSPNLSDCEVLLDNHVTMVEENFYVSSVDKLEEETRLLTTKSVDHQDMIMESESKACMLDEPIYTNRQLLLPKSPLVNKEISSHDDHFGDISGSDLETKSSDFDPRSFEELERLIALEDSSDNVEVIKALNSNNVLEPTQLTSLAKIVVKEIETLENATVCKTTKDEQIVTRQLEEARESVLPKPLGPKKLKVLATTVLKQKESAATERGKPKEGTDEQDSATNGIEDGGEKRQAVGIVSTQAVKSHPLVVRRQQGLLNRDAEFGSVTSDVMSDTNEDLASRSTPSGSIIDESDSSSISLADKPKMDYLKPGMHTFNDDSSISDLFPDTDNEPLDDEVFLSDSCCLEPETQPRFSPQQPQTSWSELVTDQSSSVASFEAPNLLSDTQAEDFLRHMLGIHEQTCHSDASDSEQAELQEDLSACLSDVCQVVTSESESEAGEVLSEEVHSQEVTLVFAWPKGKKPLPSPSRDIAGQPYRELHVRKVTRVKDFDVEILEGPKVVYTKKNAIEKNDARVQENPEIKVSKPKDESSKLDVTSESGIFSSEGDEICQETPTDNLNLDDLLQNLSDISSELDITGEKSVQMHGRNEAWNIHAIPLVVPKLMSTSGRQSVTSDTSVKGAMEHGVRGGETLVESTGTVHEADVEHVYTSNQAIKHEDLAQHDGEKTEGDSTAVDDGDDGKTFNETRDKTDQHEDLTSKSNTNNKQIEGEHEKLMYTGDEYDKKTHARRTVIVTAVLRPSAEKQNELPKDVCPLKHCDTCKSLVHVRKVAVKGKRVRSHLKCMKCRQMISERLVSRVTKTTSCKNISEIVEIDDYCTNTWPPRRERKFRSGHCTTNTLTEHFKKHSRRTFHKISQFDTITKQDINTNDTPIPKDPTDKRSVNEDKIINLVANQTDKIKCVLPEPPTTDYTPLLSDTLIDEIDAQLSESHLSIESTESDATNPFYETSSSTDTVVGLSDSTNFVTFQNPHPQPQGLKSPPPAPDADSPTKIDDAQPKRTGSLSKEESIDSDNLDVIIEGYGSDTEELLSEIEYELQLQIPAPVYVTKVEDSSRYISIIPVKPRAEAYGSYFAIVDFEDPTFYHIATFLPKEVLHLSIPDVSMYISSIPETPRAEGYGSYVAEGPTFNRVAMFLPKEVFHLNIPDNSVYLFAIDDTIFTDPIRSKVIGTMVESAKVSSVEVKHKSAGYDARELVYSIESPTITFEPYQERIDSPDNINIIYPTVIKAVVNPALDSKEESQYCLNGFAVNEYADDVAGIIMKDTIQQLAMLYPVAKKKKKIPPVKHALDVDIEPTKLHHTEQLPEFPEELSLLSTRCINIELQMTTVTLENPVLMFANHETGVSIQFLHYAKQYCFEFGVEEYAQLGVVTNTIAKPTEAGECRWQVTAEPLYMPTAVNQILILGDYFMSEYRASQSEIAGNASLLLNSTNVKIQTVVALPPKPADYQDHKNEEQGVTKENVTDCEKKEDENLAEVEERTVEGISVTQREKRSSSNEIEFKAKAAAIKEAIQAVRGSKENLNQTTAENKHKQGTVLIKTRSHKSMHIKQMASGIVESAFHAAKGELKVMFHEQPNTSENQTQLETDKPEMMSENLNPETGNIEWKTNRKESEENKVWKGNPFIERDENRVWKGNPVQYGETQDRIIPVMQRRTNAPVSQSEVVTPRETANNVSVVDIGQVRTAGREDRALRSDAIAGARLVWKDYRGSNRFYTEHNVPDYQETVDKIMYPRMSQSTPELHTTEETEELERIKQDIINIDASGRFVLPQSGSEISLVKEPTPESKKKKELSIKIPVEVVKAPTGATTEEIETASGNQKSQITSNEQRIMSKTGDNQDSKLPDLLGGAQKFTPYGPMRTFAFGKDDVEKDTHHHKEYSKDRQYVKNSKLTTTTQHSGKHSECTFSTEGTIKDIPVFGALFGGVEDRSRPDPDHKSVQSAFDDLFGSTGQTRQTERKEIESGSKLDWYKMQEQKANVERITFKDDEAKTQRVKTLDYKVERSDETIGEVPGDLGIMAASKPIHDVSIGIARKDFTRSRRKMLQDSSPRGIEYESPAPPLSPPQLVDVSSPSPSTRRRHGSRSPKSPRRRRRPVCPEHQRVFQDAYDGHQEEIRPKIEIVREPESQIETLIHRHEVKSREVEPRRGATVRETEPPRETFIRGEELQSETIIQQEPPAESFVKIPIPVHHEEITTTKQEDVVWPERKEGLLFERKEQILHEGQEDILDVTKEEFIDKRKEEFLDERMEQILDERKEEFTDEGNEQQIQTDEEIFDESSTKQRSSTGMASDEDNEVRDIMEKSPSREALVEMKRQRKQKITHKREVEVRESEFTQSRTSKETTWKAEVPSESEKLQKVAWKSEEPDDISSTQYLFPKERKYDIVEHSKPDIYMTCEQHVEDSFEESKREIAENQKPAIEVSKKYFKAGVSPSAADIEEDEIPDRQVFYDDVAGARLVLKDKFGPSAFEVVKPQPSRRLAASTHDVSWRRPKDDRISDLSYQEKSLSTSSPSVYKRKEYTSESQTVEERNTFSEGFAQQTMDAGGGRADVPFRRIPQVPQYQTAIDMQAESMSDSEAYFRPSQKPTQRRYDYSRPVSSSCKIDANRHDDLIKIDQKGRFVLPASMISNVGKVTRPTTTTDLQVPVIETSMSASSPVLNKTDYHKFESTFEERCKSSSPVGFLKPSDSYDREVDVFQQGMSVSPSSPSFYRRNNQITVKKMEEEDVTKKARMVPVFKTSDHYVKDKDESLCTSSPSLNRQNETGMGIFRQRGAKGLIKPHEILEMEKRLGVKHVTSSSEGHLPVSTQRRDDHQEASQSCSELGSIQTGLTGISFLDTMFAHRSSAASLGSSGSTLTDTRSDTRYHDVETSDDDQPRSTTHGFSRSVDSFGPQPLRQPVGISSQARPITISSFAAESEPNISGHQRPFSARRRQPVEYVVQRHFLDDTVPYILGADVYRSDDEGKESNTFTERKKSRQTSHHYSDVEKSTRTATTVRKKPREYVLHCRSFYDEEPFISSEDVSLNVDDNDTDEVKMKKNLTTVIKKKLPQTVSTLCDGRADIHQSDEQETTATVQSSSLSFTEQTEQVQTKDRETRKISDRKLTKDDSYQYLLPKRFDTQNRLSQSAQHIPLRGQQMHHELDKEIHDLIGLSLPSLNQLLTKQMTVNCKVEAIEVPDNTARVISVSETRRRRPPHENNLSRPIQSVRTKPVTEYILHRDDSETRLKTGDVIQRSSFKQVRRNLHRIASHKPQASIEGNSQSAMDSISGTDITISYIPRDNKQHKQDQRPKHSFHVTDYEKWNIDKHPTATTEGVGAIGKKRQCAPPSDYEHVTQIPARCEGQFPVLSSPPIRRKEINVGVNEVQPTPTMFKIRNSEADVSRVIQYEQELADSDDDNEEDKSDTTRKSKTITTSTGSTGTASEPYPGVLPRSYLYGSQVPISESSSETSERDWDSFFKNLDEQNAQLYEVGSSTSDVSEDLDMILYSGYLSQGIGPLTTKTSNIKPERSLTKRGLSVEDRRQGFTRQEAVDRRSPVAGAQPFPFDTEFSISSTADDQDSFEKLFKKYEKEEYDNVPTARDVEEYDNVPFTQVSSLKTSVDGAKTVEPSKQVWNLRALLAGQDKPKVTTTEGNVFRRNDMDSRNSESKSVTTSDTIDHRYWEQTQASGEVLPDRTIQMERLNSIRGNVEELLAEVETLQTAIRASQAHRASSVVTDLPSQRQKREGSPDELRSTRSRSYDSSVADLNATERLLQDIVASVRTVDRTSTSEARSRTDINRELRSTQSEPRMIDPTPWYGPSSESDSHETKTEKTPKSILKVKTEKPISHSGFVRFSEDQMHNNNKKQPQRIKRKRVSTMAAKTSPAGRSPPIVRRIILDERETHL